MKVLHIINSLATGGAEKLLQESIPLYNDLNVTSEVLLLNGTAYPFLKLLQQSSQVAVFSIGNTSVYNPFLIFKIIPYLKKYDIVHVHLFPALYWVALAKLFSFSKVKCVYTEHSTHNKRRNSMVFKILDRIIYKQYTKIIAITPQVKIALQNHLNFQNEAFFEVIPNGVNLKAIQQAEPINKTTLFPDPKAKIIIQVARFFEPKDPKTLIRAMALLPDEVKLVLVGDGVLQDSCRHLVVTLKLQERVLFLGVRTDVPRLLKTADVVVLSSHYEGLSLSCIEGLASGKPFIASAVPGLTEIVQEAGLLFPKNDYETLAGLIQKLFEEKDFYNAIVASSQERASQYDLNKMVINYIKLYEKI